LTSEVDLDDGYGPHAHRNIKLPLRNGKDTWNRFLLGVSLFGVIPSLALPPPEAALFWGGYLISAIITVALFGLLLGHLAARRQPRILKAMMATTGFAAVYWCRLDRSVPACGGLRQSLIVAPCCLNMKYAIVKTAPAMERSMHPKMTKKMTESTVFSPCLDGHTKVCQNDQWGQ